MVNARGFLGGLIILWNDEADLQIDWKSQNVIVCTVNGVDCFGTWRLYGCYGPCKFSEKRVFWENLQNTIHSEQLPWVLLGDLNEILDLSEKLGGKDIRGQTLFLKRFLQETGTIDLGFVGHRFTWTRRVDNRIIMKERLDRVVANFQWVQNYHKATVTHVDLEESDHVPILLQTVGENEIYRRTFRFLRAWTTDGSSHELVKGAWNQATYSNREYARINQRLTITARAFKRWNATHFGYTHTRMKELEATLKEMEQVEDEQGLTAYQGVSQEETLKELRIQRARVELIYRQKSRENWLKMGDRNSRFFHASILVSRRRNRVLALFKDGVWFYERKQIEELLIRNFQNLFSPENHEVHGASWLHDALHKRRIVR